MPREPKFDFRKLEDQERFTAQPVEKQQQIKDDAHDEANELLSEYSDGQGGFDIEKYRAKNPDVNSEDNTKAAVEAVKICLEENLIRDLVKMPLTPEVFESAEVQAAARKSLIFNLEKGHDYYVDIIIKYFQDEGMLRSSEVQTAAKEFISAKFANGNIDEAKKAVSIFGLSTKEFSTTSAKEAAQSGLLKILKDGTTLISRGRDGNEPSVSGYMYERELSRANQLLELAKIQPEKETKLTAKETALLRLRYNDTDSAIKIMEIFGLPIDKELQSAAKGVLHKWLYDGAVSTALKIKEQFSIPEEYFASSEFGYGVSYTIGRLLQEDNLRDVLKILEAFSIPDDMLQKIIKTHVRDSVAGVFNYPSTETLIKAFNLPEELKGEIASSAIKIAHPTSKAMSSDKWMGRIDALKLSEEELHLLAIEAIIASLTDPSREYIEGLMKKYSITEAEIQTPEAKITAQKAFLDCLNVEYIYDTRIGKAKFIKDFFGLDTEETRPIAQQIHDKIVEKGDKQNAARIKISFLL